MGATEVGAIDLGLNIDPSMFQKQLKGIASSTEKSVTKAFAPIGKMIGSVLAVGAITAFTKSCLDLGSNLSEVQNVVDTTFKTMNEEVNRFASNAMRQFGLSETVAKKYMGTLGSMSKSMGFSEQSAFEMSKAVTGLAADVASFYNLSTDEAFTKLKSIWTGETETLKEIGVLLTQTNLDQYALNNGFGKTTAKMTEQEKVLLRYRYTMSALSDASGDFAKTAGSWANQTRILSLQLDAIKATLGQGFINLFTPIIQMVNTLLGKLQVLAGYFKQFTEFLTGNQGESAAAGVAADTGAAAENAANMASGAKEAAKALSGIDKLNLISDAGSAGAGAGQAQAGDLGLGSLNGNQAKEQIEEAEGALGRFSEKFKELRELFRTGFSIGLGTPDFGKLRENIENIRNSLKNIFSSPEIKAASENLLKALAVNTGKITGAYVSVGTTIGKNITGGLDKYLSKNQGYITERIAGIINGVAESLNEAGDFATVFADIFSVFGGENGTDLTARLTELFVNPILAVTQLIVSIVHDALSLITVPVIENKEQIKAALDELLGILATLAGTAADCATDIGEAVLGIYNTHISPTIENVKTGISELMGVGLELWNTYVAPFLQDTADKIDSLMKRYVAPFVSKLIKFGAQIVEIISIIWKNWLVPMWTWIDKTFIPIFTKLAGKIVRDFQFIGEQIGVVVNMAMDILNGLAEFIAGALTNDFERAGYGIRDIFKGVINGIIGFFENGINFIIDKLNSFLSSLSGITTKIGDVIGKDIPIQKISRVSVPRLAQGGYVKANQPQLAMIGDNRHEGEIVAPESKLLEMARMAAGDGISGKELMEIILLLREILSVMKELSAKELLAVIQSSDIYRAWKQEKKEEKKRLGTESW